MGNLHTTGTAASDSAARLLAVAQELQSLRNNGGRRRDCLGKIVAGLSELSALAKVSGRLRLARACKSLSNMLIHIEKHQEEDIDFILSTALNFLDGIKADCGLTNKETE